MIKQKLAGRIPHPLPPPVVTALDGWGEECHTNKFMENGFPKERTKDFNSLITALGYDEQFLKINIKKNL